MIPENILQALLLRPVNPTIIAQYRMDCSACMKITGLPALNSNEDTVALEHTVYDMLGMNSL